MPVIHLWNQDNGVGRIVVGKGTGLEIWALDRRGAAFELLNTESHPTHYYGGNRVSSSTAKGGLDDITAVESIDDDHLLLSHVSGHVAKIKIEDDGVTCRVVEKARYSSPTSSGPTIVQALQARQGVMYTATTSRPRTSRRKSPLPLTTPTHDHTLSTYTLSSPWLPPSTLALPSKPWSLHLSPSSTPTWLATGLSSFHPLSLYPISSTGQPIDSPRHLLGTEKKSAVYGLCTPHRLAPNLRYDTTLIAGFYDSVVRLYDLRSSSPAPFLSFSDQWNDDPIYSVTSGGPTGSYLVTGKSRNASLTLFDVRHAKESLTIFAPEKDASPVYGVEMEYGRIWGVTDRRAFGVDLESEREELEGVAFYRSGVGRLEKTQPAAGRR